MSFNSFSQQIQESIIWDIQRKLSWEDFKGTVPIDAVPAAITASGISYKYSANLIHHEVILDFEVNAFFYPNESWYKPKFCDDNILAHEQLHFNITELFARKMRIKLRETSFSDNVKSEIKDIYKEILKELTDLQERYDWETDFSKNRAAQSRWNERISEAFQKK